MIIKINRKIEADFKSLHQYYLYKFTNFFRGIKYNLHEKKILLGIMNEKVYTGPSLVQIDITNKCNNNCIGCWCNSPLLGEKAPTQNFKNQELPFKTVQNLIDDLKSLGATHLYFSGGGEPFIHPNFLDIAEYAKKKGFHLDMNTNFTLVDERAVERLVDMEFDHMNISLWAATPETYVKLHPNKTKRDFYRIEKMLKFMSELKKTKRNSHIRLGGKPTDLWKRHINLYNVIFNKNYHEIDKMVDFALNVQADSLHFVPLDPIRGKTDHFLLNETEKKMALKKLEEGNKKLKGQQNPTWLQCFICEYEQFRRRLQNKGYGKGEYESSEIKKKPCYVGWAFVRILANGDVNFCLKSDESLGSIYKKSFNNIWKSEKYEKLRIHAKDRLSYPFFEKIGCHKTCDNIWLNEAIERGLKTNNMGSKQKQR